MKRVINCGNTIDEEAEQPLLLERNPQNNILPVEDQIRLIENESDNTNNVSDIINNDYKREVAELCQGDYWTGEEIQRLREISAREAKRLIETVLPPKWQKAAERFPFLRAFPVEQLWRLCVSGRWQGKEPNYTPIDPEPGYMVSTARALCMMLDGLGIEELTANYYEKVHIVSVDGLPADVHKGGEKKIHLQGFISEQMCKKISINNPVQASFGLSEGPYCTKAGFQELKDKSNKRDHPLSKAGSIYSQESMFGVSCSFIGYQLTLNQRQEIMTCTYDQYHKDIKEAGDEVNPCDLTWDVLVSTRWDAMMGKKWDTAVEEALNAIISGIQDPCQEHLIPDGNGRQGSGFSHKLLPENGFLPTILPSTSVLAGMSVREIKACFRYGWEKIKAICEGSPLENCHETPQRKRKIDEFDLLDQNEQEHLEHMIGQIDFCLLARAEICAASYPHLDNLRRALSSMFDDKLYDLRVAMMALKDVEDIIANPSPTFGQIDEMREDDHDTLSQLQLHIKKIFGKDVQKYSDLNRRKESLPISRPVSPIRDFT